MNVRVAHIVAIRPAMAVAKKPSTPGRPSLPVEETTVGGRLRALRKAARPTMGQEVMAAALGITRPMVSKYETGEHNPPDYIIERAAKLLGVTAAFLRYGDTTERMERVKGRVGAGAHIEAIEAPPYRWVEIPVSWTDALVLEVDGLSFYPIYDDRDIIVVRGPQRMAEDEFLNRICVVETTTGLGMVKRVRRGREGRYDLESPNAPTMQDVELVSARPVKLHLA